MYLFFHHIWSSAYIQFIFKWSLKSNDTYEGVVCVNHKHLLIDGTQTGTIASGQNETESSSDRGDSKLPKTQELES